MILNYGYFSIFYVFMTNFIFGISGKPLIQDSIHRVDLATSAPLYDYDDYTTDAIDETTNALNIQHEFAELGFQTEKFEVFTIKPSGDEEHKSGSKLDLNWFKGMIRGWLPWTTEDQEN